MSMAEIISRINAPAARHVGTVRFFYDDKGWGFIKRDGAGDVFVHAQDLQRSEITSLHQDQRVEFEIRDGQRGPIACNIRPLSLAGEN